jgi:hypothetical protein
MKFALPFFLVLIFGTAGMHYGAQPLWRALGFQVQVSRPTVAVPEAPAHDPYLRPATPTEVAVVTPAVVAPVAAAPAAAVSHTPRLTRVLEPVETPAPPARTTTSDKPEAPTAEASATTSEPATEPAVEPAVASKPVPPPTKGTKSWGMTITRASYYALSGENRGQLPGGTIIDVEDSRSTDKGVEMSLGRIEKDGAMAGPYLVANTSLVRFNVPRGDVPADSINTLKQYYALKGQLDQRVNEIKRQAISVNPYAQAYNDAVQKYNDFGTREKRLTKLRDTASGGDRMRYVDQLREMIPEGQRLLRNVETAKANYTKWKTANPAAAAAVPDTASDTQAQDLRRQIAALEPKVREIVQ